MKSILILLALFSLLYVFFTSFSLFIIIKQKAQTQLNPRVLQPAFPEHALHSIAPLVNDKYKVGVLITDFNYESSLYLYNTSSALSSASSQLISKTTFTGQYARDLVSLNSKGSDWFAAIFRDPDTHNDIIGMFQPNATKPSISIKGGFRTTIGANANLNCQECIVAAMMLEDFSWVVRQINFTSQAVIWEYLIQQNKFSQIFEVHMAVGLGTDNYVVNLLGLSVDGEEVLSTIDVANNKTLIYKTFEVGQAVTSYVEFYTGYNVFANRAEQVGIMNITTGNQTYAWQTTFPNDSLLNCATAYPYIFCGNMRYTGIFAQHAGEMQMWKYNMTTQPKITAPNYVVEEDNGFLLKVFSNQLKAVQHLASAYYSMQFVYTTMEYLKVVDYSQLDELDLEEWQQ